MTAPRVLVAGIGNVFLGDDGFGVAVVARLARRRLPENVEIGDYGIRGFDLASALLECDTAIIVDAIPRKDKEVGELFVLEPTLEEVGQPGAEVVNGHGMTPLEVFRLVRRFGGTIPPTYLIGCHPGTNPEQEEGSMEFSPPVAAVVDEAADLVEVLVHELRQRAADQGSRPAVEINDVEAAGAAGPRNIRPIGRHQSFVATGGGLG
ncbi:MAG: hydrogenase maturation protease [Candidatus Dormibacteraceae bacterium]